MADVQAKRVQPGIIDAEMAGRAVRRIKDYLMRYPGQTTVRVAGEHGDEGPLVLPREAVSLLAFILAQAAEGRGVTVIPSHAELTTQQAADMLNVSRPYLIKLLETGEIPFRLIGKHRCITSEDLQEYERRDDVKRRSATSQLAALGQGLGI
ncbi:excisionase family DNA-binding protein [Nonomuraea angiospora]|uniref:excisionase family DNA-binding protein n=1 Tax=Nonomuraea angiospora TaxID=46172 RepID=UPI003434D4E8